MADQSYTLQRTDPSHTIVVPPLSVNGPLSASSTSVYPNSSGSSTSLGLVGRGEPDYGRIILNNLIQMLEHFSYSTPPTNPITGQLWHNSTDNSLNLYTATGWVDITGEKLYVKQTGGEMQGTLVFPSSTKLHLQYTPASQLDAINVLYADGKYLAKTGGNLTGNVTLSANARISGVAEPINANDFTNKAYVDQAIDSVSLTSNRLEKINTGGYSFKLGTPVVSDGVDGAALAQTNGTVNQAKVIGLSLTSTDLVGSTIYVQSYGTIKATTSNWDLVTGNVGGLVVGSDYYISNQVGRITNTPPNTNGYFLVKVGTAVAPDTLAINIQQPFRL